MGIETMQESVEPRAIGTLAPCYIAGAPGVVEQASGQLTDQANGLEMAGAGAVLPGVPYAARGVRLDWATKRGLDITVAAGAFFLLLPLLLLIALLVFAGDGKPPIFRHMRLGRDGRRFGCLKFRGEMSLVGPRPIVPAEVARYGRAFATCFAVPPGVTGLWQVSGRSDTTYAERVALDLDYATRWSLRRDLAIMLRTIPAVLAQRGSR